MNKEQAVHIQNIITEVVAEADKNQYNDTIDKIKYQKLGNAGIDGVLFQISLLTIFMLNALRKSSDWRLSTENKAAGKFDDVIFESANGTTLLQAKHRKNTLQKITEKDLFSVNPKNDDFSLAKYFFSYQDVRTKFNIRNVVICTNARLQAKTDIMDAPNNLPEEHMLYFEGMENICYTFHDGITSNLEQSIKIYYDKNLKNRNTSENIITRENISDFLNHLQFIASYPYGDNLDNIIEKLICLSPLANNFCCEDGHKYMNNKMLQWFRQKSGIYLNQAQAKAIFCEIISNKYREALKQYDISFKRDVLFFSDLRKKILHIIPQTDILLHEINIYHTLQNSNALFINPEEDVTVQNEIINAFELPSYEYLVMVHYKESKQRVQEVCLKIISCLDKNPHKRVVLITKKGDKMAKQLKAVCKQLYEQINENITFMDLTESTQDRFLKKNIIFQGHLVSLKKLLAQSTSTDLHKTINLEMLTKLVRNDIIEIGTELKCLADNFRGYYVYRSFNRNHKKFSEKQMTLLNSSDIKEKIILISDSAGTGKTTVLKNLACSIKECSPYLWITWISLIGYTQALRDFQRKGTNYISITEFLDSQEYTKMKSNFEKCLFSMPNKVILMMDGIDEISSDYKDIILNLLIDCKKGENFAKIFVTTRSHLRQELEHRLEVQSFTLEPFSIRDQINFLRRYWAKNLLFQGRKKKRKCRMYALTLIKSLSTWTKENTGTTFASIPLHARMVAEIFQENLSFGGEENETWEGCKQFLIATAKKPKMPRKINLAELYQIFIDKKRDVFIYDKVHLNGNTVAEEALKEKFKECCVGHYNLALELLLNKSDRELFSCYKSNQKQLEKENLLKLGILQEIQGQVHFIHRTFAEYFVAECLINELKYAKQFKKFKNFLIDDVLFWNRYDTVRTFFDCFLQKELHSLPQSTFEAYHFVNYTSKLNNRMFLHSLSREGYTGIISFLLHCFNFNNFRSPWHRLITKLQIKRINIDIPDSFGRTALHEAAEKGHLDVVKLLVENGADVNKRNENGSTPLNGATAWLKTDVVKYLVEKGADINNRDRNGDTPLLEAARSLHFDLVKFLVEKGADVNAKNKNGITVLQQFAYTQHTDIINCRQEKSEDFTDSVYCTSLRTAAYSRSLDVAKLLVKHGSDVNIERDGNRVLGGQLQSKKHFRFTALHLATDQRSFDIIKFLVENGADTTITDGCDYTGKDK